MRYSSRFLSCVLLFSALSAGCVTAPQDHYYWGSYEALILAMYAELGSADPVMQIEKLTADLQQAESIGKPAPPGLHAHLGYLYAMNGNVPLAEAAFNEERALFPESAVFIDGMLERALQNQGVSNAPPE